MQPSNAAAPFLSAYPPWYARTTGWVIVATAAAAVVFSLTVEFPIAVESRFTVIERSPCAGGADPQPAAGIHNRDAVVLPAADCPAVLVGEMNLPQRAFPDVSPGQPVELYYDALPMARWGVRSGTLSFVDSAVTDGQLVARFEVDRLAVRTAHGERSLGPGATGTARIILGRYTVFERALLPLRTMRARWVGPVDEPRDRP